MEDKDIIEIFSAKEIGGKVKKENKRKTQSLFMQNFSKFPPSTTPKSFPEPIKLSQEDLSII